jgi:glycerol uptake facilitator-like aquaporin
MEKLKQGVTRRVSKAIFGFILVLLLGIGAGVCTACSKTSEQLSKWIAIDLTVDVHIDPSTTIELNL